MGELDDFGKSIPNPVLLRTSRNKGEDCQPVIAKEPQGACGLKPAQSRSIQWADRGDGKYLACGRTESKLPAGLYDFYSSELGVIFCSMKINIDEIIEFPDNISSNIISEVEVFWDASSKFKEHKFLHRRGFLLYGAAGNGKSMAVQLIVKKIIERDGIAFVCGLRHPAIVDEALRSFRSVEPNRHIVCIFEDLDAYIDKYGESEILSLLDGENQLDDVLNIATTNYPEKLDKRIVGRPRRFDRLIKVVAPGLEIRELYLEKKLSLKNGEAKEWARKTEGFTFAALADLVISVKCLNKSFDEALKLLSELINNKASSAEFETTRVGFNRN